MSSELARLLGQDKNTFSTRVIKLEERNGNPSHDNRLFSEVLSSVRKKVADIGLDPQDTSAEELYHGLQAKYKNDSLSTDELLGIKAGDGFETRLNRAIGLVHGLSDKQLWSLKIPAAKKLLAEAQPKKLARSLGYRSTDSMLKREEARALFLMLPFAESQTWQTDFSRKLARLPSNSYDLGRINYAALPTSNLIEPGDLYVCNQLLAAAAVWPDKKLDKEPVVSLALLLIQATEKLGVRIPLKSLLQIHPSLAWWSDAKHLISTHDTPVSFNIHDVAANQRLAVEHHEASLNEAAKSLWAELEGRYSVLSDKAAQAARQELNQLMPQMATEYSEA